MTKNAPERSGPWTSAPSTRIYSDVFPGWQIANEIAKSQVSMNSDSSSTDWKKLQPKTEICNRKYKVRSTRVVKKYKTSIRVLAAALYVRRGCWHVGKLTSSSMRLLPRSSVFSLARHASDAGKYFIRFSRSSNDSKFDRLHTYSRLHTYWFRLSIGYRHSSILDIKIAVSSTFTKMVLSTLDTLLRFFYIQLWCLPLYCCF